MVETSARLLKLLALLQTRRDWSGPELAGRLGITERTVRRDIEKLRGLGYPVHAARGVAGGYRLGAGTALPPLQLDDEEAVAVVVGLQTMAGAIEGIEETSVRALVKLEQVLPTRLRSRISALSSSTTTVARGVATVDAATLSLLATCCRDHMLLRFDYTGHEGGSSYRRVEPHRLVHSARRWYLVGWDLERGDWRTFRVDRLTPREPTGPQFRPRPAPPQDVGAFASWSLGVQGYRHQARITVYAPAATVAEKVPFAAGVIEPIDEHTCTLLAGSNSLDGLAVFLAVLGPEFTVHEPPELIEHVREVALRLGRAAGG